MTIEFLSDNSINLKLSENLKNNSVVSLFPLETSEGILHIIPPDHPWHPNDGSKLPVLIMDELYNTNPSISFSKPLPTHTWYFPNQNVNCLTDLFIHNSDFQTVYCKYAPLTSEGKLLEYDFYINYLKKQNKILKNKNKKLNEKNNNLILYVKNIESENEELIKFRMEANKVELEYKKMTNFFYTESQQFVKFIKMHNLQEQFMNFIEKKEGDMRFHYVF